ncbi:MAG: hypothetical protein D6826_01060 [Alphaproteobacteria bacterium]|nr:MAG: hypothetical protein D6826_01060 [Alphaproteobacteria bacterium]
MAEIISQILTYAWAAWRRRRYALIVSWLVCAVGWIGVISLPDNYESSTVVYVDTANILGPLLKGLAIETESEAELELMQKTLVSRPNLEKVIRQTDLDLTVDSPAELELLIADLGDRIRVGRTGSNLFSISVTDNDPKRARDIVQALLTIFVENNLGRSREDMDTARRFIEEQIQIYEKQLEEAEQRLARFQQENIGLLGGQSGYKGKIEAAEQELALAESQLRDAELRRATLRRELADIPQYLPSSTPSNSLGPSSDTDIKILEIQKTLDDLLSRYTDKHPDVVIARRKLEALLKLQEEELNAAAERARALGQEGASSPSPETGGTSNPVYEQLKVQLVQEEANIATLTERVAQARAKVKRIRDIAARVPEVEAELAKLNRDYDVIRGKYNELLSRREAERISRAKELEAENVTFRILEPPTVPAIPSGPNRYIFLVLVLMAGIGSGVGFSLLLALSSETFSSVTQLRQAFTVPVYGAVGTSDCAPRSAWALGASIVFWIGTLGLISIFVALVLLEWRIGLNNVPAFDTLTRISTGLMERLPIF